MKRTRLAALLAAALLVVASGYEAVLLGRQRRALADEQRRAERLEEQLAALRRQRDEANRALADAEQKRVAEETSEAGEQQRRAELRAWDARTRDLKRMFVDHPEQRIPELQLLSELDWFSLAHRFSLDTENDQRRARAAVRDAAVKKFLPMLRQALREYVASTGGQLPADAAHLLSYFQPPVDPAILARYEMSGSGSARTHEAGGVDTIAERTPVDADYDWRHTARTDGQYWGPWDSVELRNVVLTARRDLRRTQGNAAPSGEAELLPYISNPTWRGLVAASAEFQLTHDGQRPTASSDLRPFVADPIVRAKLEQMIRQEMNSPDWKPGAR
jgi:hypothetical protein